MADEKGLSSGESITQVIDLDRADEFFERLLPTNQLFHGGCQMPLTRFSRRQPRHITNYDERN